jgi:hypothetical protein
MTERKKETKLGKKGKKNEQKEASLVISWKRKISLSIQTIAGH